jgi:hypothetical protein
VVLAHETEHLILVHFPSEDLGHLPRK